MCPASERSWDPGNNTEPHSPVQLSTASLSPVLLVNLSAKGSKAVVYPRAPLEHLGQEETSNKWACEQMEVFQNSEKSLASYENSSCWFAFFFWKRHYSTSMLARETAKGSGRWTCNILLICWDHLEWVSVVQWRTILGSVDWRLPLISEKAISWCFREIMLPSSSLEQASTLLPSLPC